MSISFYYPTYLGCDCCGGDGWETKKVACSNCWGELCSDASCEGGSLMVPSFEDGDSAPCPDCGCVLSVSCDEGVATIGIADSTECKEQWIDD